MNEDPGGGLTHPQRSGNLGKWGIVKEPQIDGDTLPPTE